MKMTALRKVCLPFWLLISVALAQNTTAPVAGLAEKERFLLKAKVTKTTHASRGITDTARVTMTDGTLTHDASVQTIDEFKLRFEGTGGTELNFKDTYKFNIAAYKLARLLQIPMVPPSVPRKHNGMQASFTWWVDDAMMDELDRYKNHQEPPDQLDWNNQMYIVRVFDQLIFNTDRNLGNLVIDKEWNLWMIDHTRAFRMFDSLREEKNLDKCEAGLLERLKALTAEQCKRELKQWLNPMEIEAILKRRDKIVAHFEKAGPSKIYTYQFRHKP